MPRVTLLAERRLGGKTVATTERLLSGLDNAGRKGT
jgi:hypothetical protein